MSLTISTATQPKDVGVVVGRFQVDELTRGHRELLQSVVDLHEKVIVVLGRAAVPCTRTNPLDVQSRMQMIYADFPDVVIAYVNDHPSDETWCKNLDRTIADLVGPNQSVVLYGSRDSFIDTYRWGRYETVVLEPSVALVSGTQRRVQVARVARANPAWRAGVIWASQQRYATCYPTVDIAIFRPDLSEILLGRKTDETLWRLPGGFADPCSERYEDDAIREALEETSCKVENLHYITSAKIDDWRYRGSEDCIKSMLFVGTTADAAVAADDLAEVRWFPVSGFPMGTAGTVARFHSAFADAALRYVKTHQKGTL